MTLSEPTDQKALREISAPISAPVKYRNTRGGAFARITTAAYGGTIQRLCFIWSCQLPLEISGLRIGDVVTVWAKGDEIWQLSQADKILLSFANAKSAFSAQLRRGYLIFGAFVVLGITLLFLAYLVRPPARSLTSSDSDYVP
jgi:hypothetical protein